MNTTMAEAATVNHPVVSLERWVAERKALLAREKELTRLHDQIARERRALPFAVTVDDRFAGQLTVTNITGGSARWAQIGYWVDERYAGQGVMPTAVALVTDYCLFELDLHRVEVAIRPENTASLRVVEKLGLEQVGYAPRFLHIDGAWRDHRIFAVTAEEAPEGVVVRLEAQQSHQ